MSREQNIQLEEPNNYPRAFLATGIIVIVAAFLCYIIIMDNPPPVVDGTGGILVNYGTTDAGMGKDINSTEEPSVAPNANHEQTSKVTPAPTTEQKSQVETSNEKVVTQDNEDAPAVSPNSKKPSKSATAEVAKPVKKEVVNQAALYKGAAKAGNGAGDGTTNTPGNQGSKNGSPLASNYGDGGSGNGVSGTQWSFVTMPSVKNVNRMEGTVVIDITIDANGNVTEAHSDRKTRMGDLDLINRCIGAVKESKLTSANTASGNQKGQVTFKFDVD
jgi:outer membrane biosynthesis protein TonB